MPKQFSGVFSGHVLRCRETGSLEEPATTFAAPDTAVPNGIRLSVNVAHGLEVFERSVEKIAYLMRSPTEKMTR